MPLLQLGSVTVPAMYPATKIPTSLNAPFLSSSFSGVPSSPSLLLSSFSGKLAVESPSSPLCTSPSPLDRLGPCPSGYVEGCEAVMSFSPEGVVEGVEEGDKGETGEREDVGGRIREGERKEVEEERE